MEVIRYKSLYRRVKKIKNIVVPLIDQQDYWFYNLEYPSFQFFYDNLKELSDNVFKVSAQEKMNGPQGFNDLRSLDLSVIEVSEAKETIIDSSTKLIFTSPCDWCYIPFNYDGEVRKNKLIDCMHSYRIDLTIFKQGVDAIYEHIDEIKAAYRSVLDKDGANKTSLILYSGSSCGEHGVFQYQSVNQ